MKKESGVLAALGLEEWLETETLERENEDAGDDSRLSSLRPPWGQSARPHSPFVIALVGGGGKTTLMNTIGRELAETGRRVFLTTSTHIALPETGNVLILDPERRRLEFLRREDTGERFFGGGGLEQAPALGDGNSSRRDLLAASHTVPAGISGPVDDFPFPNIIPASGGFVFTAGTLETPLPAGDKGDISGSVPPQRKLTALPEPLYSCLKSLVDVAVVEADGAKRHPLKVPAAHEPVIWPDVRAVLGVAGLSALGRPVGETLFRRELSAWDGDQIVTAELIAELLSSPHGARKQVHGLEYRAVLNQCDTQEQLQAAKEIGAMLQSQGIHGAALSWGQPRWIF